MHKFPSTTTPQLAQPRNTNQSRAHPRTVRPIPASTDDDDDLVLRAPFKATANQLFVLTKQSGGGMRSSRHWKRCPSRSWLLAGWVWERCCSGCS